MKGNHERKPFYLSNTHYRYRPEIHEIVGSINCALIWEIHLNIKFFCSPKQRAQLKT